MNTIDSGTKIY